MANYESRKLLNFLGFVASILIAAAILIAGIVCWIDSGHFGAYIPGLGFGHGLATALVCLANIIAYILCIVAGFAYAKSKRNMAYMIVQIVATVIIVFVLITSMF